MVRITSKSQKMRRKEIRKYIVLPGDLKTARKTQLRSAAYINPRGKRVVSEGELSAVLRGIEEDKFYALHGTPEQKARAVKLLPVHEDILRDLMLSMHKHEIEVNQKDIAQKREEIRAKLEKQRKPITPYEKAKLRIIQDRESK